MSRITVGWLARHTPQGPGGRQAALIDIAQDLLLARLHRRGVFDHLIFKGGTALRKLYAGNAGRFSTDLDFSIRDPADDPETVAELLRGEIDGQDIEGFRYSVEDHRGRAQVRYETPFGGVGNLSTKLDSSLVQHRAVLSVKRSCRGRGGRPRGLSCSAQGRPDRGSSQAAV
jgi:predicted nucleotidyltransferase component of viral defense system